jgi:hypothetical protein
MQRVPSFSPIFGPAESYWYTVVPTSLHGHWAFLTLYILFLVLGGVALFATTGTVARCVCSFPFARHVSCFNGALFFSFLNGIIRLF